MADDNAEAKLKIMLDELESLSLDIENEAKKRHKKADSYEYWDTFSRIVAAVLAVATPSLVSFTSGQDVSSDALKLFASLLAATSGAMTTIISLLSLQKKFVQNGIDAIDLTEVNEHLLSEKKAADLLASPYDKYSKLHLAITDARRSYREITAGRLKNELQRKISENK